MKLQNITKRNYGGGALIFSFLVVLMVLFFYLDRQNQLSSVIQMWGPGGILLSILLVAALCTTPIPSEGLVILLLKIYGVYEGILISWFGYTLGSLPIFYLARNWGQEFFQNMVTPDRFNTIDHWIKKKSSLGLLFARLLPIPAFAVNYIAGLMPSVKLWPYLWTAAISIIPYYLGVALVYLGVVKSTWISMAGGGIIILIIWFISYLLSEKSNKSII